jgi:hypothetical protein
LGKHLSYFILHAVEHAAKIYRNRALPILDCAFRYAGEIPSNPCIVEGAVKPSIPFHDLRYQHPNFFVTGNVGVVKQCLAASFLDFAHGALASLCVVVGHHYSGAFAAE